MKKLIASLCSAVVWIAVMVGGAVPASANSAYSKKVYYTSSTYQWSYAYISSQADSKRCGNFNSWTKLTNTKKKVKWVKDVAAFKAYGLGSITVGSSTGASITNSDVKISWKNSNGAKGAYLSGTVCAHWAIIYVGMQSSGSALYNGTTRVTSTPWL